MNKLQKDEAERRVLRVLLAIPGAPPGAQISDIARDAQLSVRAAWAIVQKLVGRGKVVRVRDTNDRRHGIKRYQHATPNGVERATARLEERETHGAKTV